MEQVQQYLVPTAHAARAECASGHHNTVMVAPLEVRVSHGFYGCGSFGGVPLTQRGHEVQRLWAGIWQQLAQGDGRERRECEAHGCSQLQAF